MIVIFNECMRILIDVVGKYADIEGNSVDIKKYVNVYIETYPSRICGGLTMDVIAKSAFAIDIDAQRDHNSPFMKYANEFFDFRISDKRVIFLGITIHHRSYILAFAVLFPNVSEKISKWFNYQIFGNESMQFFTRTVTDVLRDRKKNPRNVSTFCFFM